MVAWIVEHVADTLSKYEVGADGRTGYERMKGQPNSHEVVEFGEKTHYEYRKGSRRHQEPFVESGVGWILSGQVLENRGSNLDDCGLCALCSQDSPSRCSSSMGRSLELEIRSIRSTRRPS